MQIQPGHKVLDVGYGPGADTVALSQIVGSTGQVFGVDYDAAMVAEADQQADNSGGRAWVRRGVFFNSASMALIGGRKA